MTLKVILIRKIGVHFCMMYHIQNRNGRLEESSSRAIFYKHISSFWFQPYLNILNISKQGSKKTCSWTSPGPVAKYSTNLCTGQSWIFPVFTYCLWIKWELKRCKREHKMYIKTDSNLHTFSKYPIPLNHMIFVINK
mgnify:CR=1 FL=1